MKATSVRERAERIDKMAGRTCDHIINYSGKPCEACVEQEIIAAEQAAREPLEQKIVAMERQLAEASARIAVEVEDNARDAAYIVKLEQQLAEARKDKADLLEAIRRVLRKLQRDGVAPG